MKLTQTFTEKYYTFTPGEFLPIRVDGHITNMREFHAYKAKKTASRIGHALAIRIDRAFTTH